MHPAFLSYGALGLAIILEVIGTSFLQQSHQFSRLWPTVGLVLSYTGTFYFLSIALKTMPVGVAYAIWGGMGVVLVSIVGLVAFKQSMDAAALLGIGLIITGVLVINLFSKSMSH